MVGVLEYLTIKEQLKFQLVCKAWHERKVPMSLQPIKLNLLKMEVAHILDREPKGTNEKCIALWKQMRPFSVSLLEDYWQKIEPNKPLFEDKNLKTHVWRDKLGWVCEGLKNKTGK